MQDVRNVINRVLKSGKLKQLNSAWEGNGSVEEVRGICYEKKLSGCYYLSGWRKDHEPGEVDSI